MAAVRDAPRARATTSSIVVSVASMVTTEFCAIGAMTPARPGLNRLFTMTLIVSGCTPVARRSEEHTSELQSRPHIVCRLLLEKKTTHCLYVSFLYKKYNLLCTFCYGD